MNLSLERAEELLADAKSKLYTARLKRQPPILDDKIIAGWNGLMISAFAQGGSVLGRQEFIDRAVRAAEFIQSRLWVDGKLGRAWRSNKVRYDAYLDDYAFLIAGLLDLHEVTQHKRWLDWALALQGVLDRDFKDPAGGYYFVAKRDDQLLVRDKPDYDGAIPTGNSVAVSNLVRLSLLTGDIEYDVLARRTLTSFGQTLSRAGRSLTKMLSGLDFLLDDALQIIVVSPDENSNLSHFKNVLAKSYLPNKVVVYTTDEKSETLGNEIEIVAGKKSVAGKPTAYVCRGTTCSLPLVDTAAFKRELAQTTPYTR